jgi:hypothetical protein
LNTVFKSRLRLTFSRDAFQNLFTYGKALFRNAFWLFTLERGDSRRGWHRIRQIIFDAKRNSEREQRSGLCGLRPELRSPRLDGKAVGMRDTGCAPSVRLWRSSRLRCTDTVAIRRVCPSPLDTRFAGDPWVIQGRAAIHVCIGNFRVAHIDALPFDVPGFNRLLDRVRTRRNR